MYNRELYEKWEQGNDVSNKHFRISDYRRLGFQSQKPKIKVDNKKLLESPAFLSFCIRLNRHYPGKHRSIIKAYYLVKERTLVKNRRAEKSLVKYLKWDACYDEGND